MAQSLSLLYVHLVFHISNNSIYIHDNDLEVLYSYIGGVIKRHDCNPVCIGGMPDHIHILCVLSKNKALADLVREVKRSSTVWIKERHKHYRTFQWQNGYGAFSVSVSKYEKVIQYINNQKIHHKKRSFKEEYILFLKESGMEYDKRYLWND